MKYFYILIFASIFTANAMATTDNSLSQSQTPLTLRTVMNPNGVTREEWQMMFEGERRSIREQAEQCNDFIKLFNDYFEKCSPEQLKKHSATHKEFTEKELLTNCTPIQTNSLDCIENVEEIFEKLRWLEEVTSYLICHMGLYESDISPLNKSGTNPLKVKRDCKSLKDSFKTPLTPIQFAHADKVHKNGINGEGGTVLIVEHELVSGHAYFKNNSQIKGLDEQHFNDDYRKNFHGAHVTGIVHQMAPKAEVFVEKRRRSMQNSSLAKIINTSYLTPIPLVHMLSEEKVEKIKKIILESNDKDYQYQFIKRIFEDDKKFNDTMEYIDKSSKKPGLAPQPLFQNEKEKVEYEKEVKAYEEDYAGTVIKRAMQESYHDAKRKIQRDLDFFKDKLRIQGFGNSYEKNNWNNYSLPSLLMEDEFLDQSILVMNINRENELARSSNRPDHTVKESIQTILRNIGNDDEQLVDQRLQKIQAASLCALGTNVWSAGANDSYRLASGTSMAAPQVAGVAALIEGMHPDFSVKEMRGCLLNSASREFVIGTGEDALYVVDKPQEQIDALNKKNSVSQKYIAFDPGQYGKGILCGETALKYAEFKSANRSASIEELVLKLMEWKLTQ